MNQKGNNWAAFGKKNTGKTYEVMQFARYFNERAKNPKRIIIFDHSNNTSYADVTDVIDMDRLRWQLPARAVVKVQSTDFDTFAELVLMYVRNAVIVIDDSSAYFRNNVNDIRLRFLKSPKNNGNEYMFQCHSLRESAPLLLENIDIFMLKETRDQIEGLPAKVPGAKRIELLLREIANENKLLPEGEKWATRCYDQEEDTVWRKYFDSDSDNVLDSYEVESATDYLKL